MLAFSSLGSSNWIKTLISGNGASGRTEIGNRGARPVSHKLSTSRDAKGTMTPLSKGSRFLEQSRRCESVNLCTNPSHCGAVLTKKQTDRISVSNGHRDRGRAARALRGCRERTGLRSAFQWKDDPGKRTRCLSFNSNARADTISLPNYSSCFGLSGVGVSGPLFVQRRPTVFRDFGGATFGSSYPNSFWRRALISLELTLNVLSRSWRTF